MIQEPELGAGSAERSADWVQTLVVGPSDLPTAMALPRRRYDFLRVDLTTQCNIRCNYCEIGRGKLRLSLAEARRFYEEKVEHARHVFLGCAMEPTIDRNLAAHLQLVRETVNPPGDLAIQTNGTLLERHDAGALRAAGLNLVSLSIDSIDPETMRILRDGTDVEAVIRQLSTLRREIPQLEVMFSSVVTSLSLPRTREFIEFAIDFGVREVWFREVTYQYQEPTPEREALLLQPGEFAQLEAEMQAYRSRIPIYFLTHRIIVETDAEIARRIRG